jgi:glycosyltransferase involved in cell wall biosynthesis
VSSYQLVLNLLPIKQGGGLQKTLSLIRAIGAYGKPLPPLKALVEKSSDVSRACAEEGLRTIEASSGNIGRLRFELNLSRIFSAPSVCFNAGGPVLLAGAGPDVINVSECAYSNLFYPELDFWGDKRGFQRRKVALIDHYRRWSLGRADFWIFETEAVRSRAISLAGFPAERTTVVNPAPSALVTPEEIVPELRDRFKGLAGTGFRFLFLGSAYANKRLHCLPRVANQMMRRGLRRFAFVLTLPSESTYWHGIKEEAERHGCADQILNIGPVPQSDISSLIDAVDAMCCVSRLESFSNNFVEAWRMGRPLVVTDADWARSSCGDAALYVDIESEGVADSLMRLCEEKTLRDGLVQNGFRQLETYPTPEQKLDAYLKVFEEAYRVGPAPPECRGAIRWP